MDAHQSRRRGTSGRPRHSRRSRVATLIATVGMLLTALVYRAAIPAGASAAEPVEAKLMLEAELAIEAEAGPPAARCPGQARTEHHRQAI